MDLTQMVVPRLPVRNVAQPLIRHAYNIYTLNGHREVLAAAAGGIS